MAITTGHLEGRTRGNQQHHCGQQTLRLRMSMTSSTANTCSTSSSISSSSPASSDRSIGLGSGLAYFALRGRTMAAGGAHDVLPSRLLSPLTALATLAALGAVDAAVLGCSFLSVFCRFFNSLTSRCTGGGPGGGGGFPAGGCGDWAPAAANNAFGGGRGGGSGLDRGSGGRPAPADGCELPSGVPCGGRMSWAAATDVLRVAPAASEGGRGNTAGSCGVIGTAAVLATLPALPSIAFGTVGAGAAGGARRRISTSMVVGGGQDGHRAWLHGPISRSICRDGGVKQQGCLCVCACVFVLCCTVFVVVLTLLCCVGQCWVKGKSITEGFPNWSQVGCETI